MHRRAWLGAVTSVAIVRCVVHRDATTQAKLVQVENWSATHKCTPAAIHRPTSVGEVEDLVRTAHKAKRRLRVIGSGISPNGLGLSNEALLSLDQLKAVGNITSNTVTVQCGATVAEVLEELKPHNLTMENLASINLQQIGGLTQAGAHGTGASIPPCEEQIVSMTVVTPGLGTLVLSRESNAELFDWCRLGLGCLGVVTDVTLRVVPLHRLRERTEVLTRAQVAERHDAIIRSNKHARYMWIPYEDAVVVVTSNAVSPSAPEYYAAADAADNEDARALDAMRALYVKTYPTCPQPAASASFADLRDALLADTALNLDAAHIRKVNHAELAFHTAVVGERVKDFDRTLAFDCGGQQLVLEVALDAAHDVGFVLELLTEIEARAIAAPIPIEHRWTRASRAKMSPAYSANNEDDIVGWVGIVMYLTSPDAADRKQVTDAFEAYSNALRDVAKRMGVSLNVHWAKLEVDAASLSMVDADLVRRFNAVRDVVDPHRVFENQWTQTVFKA